MANRFLNNIRINDAYTFPASDGNDGQVITTDGAGNLAFENISPDAASVIYRDNFTGDGSTATFDLQNSITDEDQTQIYIDGVYQEKSTYSISGTTITFTTAPILGHSVEVISISSINTGPTVLYQDNFTGNGNDTAFTLGQEIDNEIKTFIFLNGVYQFKNTYTVDGATLTFDTAPANGVAIEVVSIASAVQTDSLEAGAVIIPVKNTHTASIAKGTPVYITGNVGSSERLQIAPADASNSAKMPAAGLLLTTLAVNEEGYVITGGYLRNLTTDTIDSTSTSSNDTVYVKAGGGLTMTKPTGTNLIQNIAKVARSASANAGSLLVSSILRTNDVPNLTTGKIWVGSANNTIESGTLHLDESNNRLGINNNSPNYSLDVTGDANISSNVIIGGNLTVDGTQTILNTQTVEVEDNILQLNTTQGSPDTATATTSGISVYRGDGVTQASFIFDDADDTWDLTNNLVVDGNATFAGQVNATRFILPSTGTTTPVTQYVFTDNTNTGTGKLVIQSGEGSAGYGGAINLFSHSHSTKPGWVTAGISSGSGGKFSVNTQGLAGGTDVFTVDTSGNATFTGNITSTGVTITLDSLGSAGYIADRANDTSGATYEYKTNGSLKWYTGLRGVSTEDFYLFNNAQGSTALLFNSSNNNATFAGEVTAVKYDVSNTSGYLVREDTGSGYGLFKSSTTNIGIASNGNVALNFDSSSDATFAKNIKFTDGAAYSSAASIRQQSSALIFSGGSTGYYFNKSDNSATHLRIDSLGNVGIGTDSPYSFAQLHIYDTSDIYIAIQKGTANGYIINDGTNISLASDQGSTGKKLLVNRNAPDNSLIIDSLGNATFNGNVTLSQPTNGSDAILNLTSKSGAGNSRTSSIEYDADNEYMYFKNAGTTVATMTSGGNVGIGTSSPSLKLHIAGTTSSETQAGISNSSTGDAVFYFDASNGDFAGTDYMSIGQANDLSGFIAMSQNAGSFHIKTGSGGSNRLTVTQGGNVGIGVTSPAEKLHIRDASSNADVYIKIANDSRDWFMGVLGSNSDILSFKTHDAANLLNITSGGNVGIGTTSPGTKLEIYGNTSSGGFGVYPALTIKNDNTSGYSAVHFNQSTNQKARIEVSNSTGSMGLYTTAAANGILINASGNVGIGTTSPLSKLQVNGDIGIGEINSTRSTNVRFAKNDVNVITFTIRVPAIGAWRPGSCWIQVSGSQNGLQEYYSAWYFIRLTHYYGSGVAGQGTSNPACILDSGGNTSSVTVGVIGSNNITTHQEITITLTDVGGTTNSMVADINCTMQVGIESIT